MDTTAPTVQIASRGANHGGSDPTSETLDRVYQQLTQTPSSAGAALDALSRTLIAAKRAQSAAAWDRTIDTCRRHPLRELLHEDPLTARAFAMSRGYQGDAELLDIIYDRDYRRVWKIPVTPVGDAIFRHTIDCQAPAAVRERRRFLAAEIDEVCAQNRSAEILSVACGHLRELELSEAIQSSTFGRFVGLDQDLETLDAVRSKWGQFGVEAMPASVTAFLFNPLPAPAFDFVYSAGLYDYLEPTFALLVTQKLIEMVRPGGRLLIGNYTSNTVDAGYMEAFMGWKLLYRDEAAMLELAAHRRVQQASIIPDTTGAVIYLDVRVR